jgi:NADPH:quinone reductase-like Zn-dependent oxidoreductase
MKAAIVRAAGQAPVYADFPAPEARPGENRIRVKAAALSPLTKSRASGAHYSASHEFPFVPGVDGVGRLDDGRRVYFLLPRAPYGAMAEETVISAAQCVPVPDDLDDVTAAAIANPGMSSWAACSERAHLGAGETVLVNGATGVAGSLAIQVVRRLGAKTVIATGRNAQALQSVGADVTIPLVEDDAALDASLRRAFAGGVDVVLDYLWGRSAERILATAAKTQGEGRPLRFVQIGSTSGANITLPSAALRSSAIELMGSGLGSVRGERLLDAIHSLFEAAGPARFRVATHLAPFARIELQWSAERRGRTVFTMG